MSALDYPPTTLTEFDSLAARLTERVQRPDYPTWRERVRAVGGCAQPIHLQGEFRIEHLRTGATLAARSGRVFTPCGNRRESVCPACSDRYAADAFHLIRAGLCGGKGIPDSVATKPRLFLTLTAPSFGPVHSRRSTDAGKTIPCGCGQRHHSDDPRIGTALDAGSYDYIGAVLWQAHAGELWHRFTIRLRRVLAHAAGITVRDFPAHARLSYTKVAEYQRRGLVHFHAILRLDGPNGAHDPAPAWASAELLADAVHTAARTTMLERALPGSDGVTEHHTFRWGTQLDTRPIAAADAESLEQRSGAITDYALAGYIAKYATKGTDTTEAVDRPIRSEHDIDHLPTTEHHRRMIHTAWTLGARPGLRHLRTWAHMLGFRGHFLTTSQHYSTRLGLLRNARQLHHYHHTLDTLGVTEDDITIINHWNHVATGYDTDAERELAIGIYHQHRQQKYESEALI